MSPIADIFNRFQRQCRWLQEPENKRRLCDGASNVSMFWVAMLSLQRVCGLINMHAGLPAPVTIISGAAVISTSHILSSSYGPELSDLILGGDPYDRHVSSSRKDALRGSTLALACYSVLERNWFRSTLPSSIISRGAYSRASARIPSTSAVASSSQRATIQKLGRLFGCHHCGRRTSIFNNQQGFIADHIPPTLFVNQGSDSWSGRIFRKYFPMSQNLYPQCRKCFSLQGSFVKVGSHFMIYHDRFRLVHLTPILVGILSSNDHVRSILDPVLDPIDRAITFIRDSLQY